MSTKQEIFLKKVVFPYIPAFQDPVIQAHHLQMVALHPKYINIEYLTELALAEVGGYNFIDAEFQDFDDIDCSDSKTTSIVFTSNQIFLGAIEKKIGALRISIYNPYTKNVDFMFIPYGQWQYMAKPCHGKNTEGKLRLCMTYSKDIDSYNQFEKYRVKTFNELATMTSEEFYKKNPKLLSMESEPSTTFLTLFGSSTVSQDDDFPPNPRNDPSEQITSPCTVTNELQQNLTPVEQEPTFLS